MSVAYLQNAKYRYFQHINFTSLFKCNSLSCPLVYISVVAHEHENIFTSLDFATFPREIFPVIRQWKFNTLFTWSKNTRTVDIEQYTEKISEP